MNRRTQQPPHSSKSSNDSHVGEALPGEFLHGEPYPGNPSEYGKVTQISGDNDKKIERKLILTLEGEIIKEYAIDSHHLSIGRKHGNDLQLNDLTLSGRHALISSIPDYVFVEDLGSTNGTLVNGSHIKKVSLKHGDVIQVGHHQLTYLCENNVKYEPTMFITAEHDETQFIYTDKNSDETPVKGLYLGGLRTFGNSMAKPVMELRKTYSTIGFQGKRMALITRGTKGYSITAISSTRSRRSADTPLLNNKPLTNNQYMLQANDVITIANYEVQFYFLN